MTTTIKVIREDATTEIEFFDGDQIADWITFEVVHGKIEVHDRGDLTLDESIHVAGGILSSKGEDEALARYLALKSEDGFWSIFRKVYRSLEKDFWRQRYEDEVPFWEKEVHFWEEDGSFSGVVTLYLDLDEYDGSWGMRAYCDHEGLEEAMSEEAAEEVAKLKAIIPQCLITKEVQGRKVQVWCVGDAPAYEVDQLSGNITWKA